VIVKQTGMRLQNAGCDKHCLISCKTNVAE